MFFAGQWSIKTIGVNIEKRYATHDLCVASRGPYHPSKKIKKYDAKTRLQIIQKKIQSLGD